MGIRGKEDPWNSIGSGAITGAVLAARGELSTTFLSKRAQNMKEILLSLQPDFFGI